MKLKKHLLIALTTVLSTVASAQTAVAHFDMSLKDGKITELVSQSDYTVASQLPACVLPGIDGKALRFDGYSNYVRAGLPSGLNTETLTVSVVLAAESYPMMQVDVAETTPTFATICGNLDEDGKKGFAFELSSQGDLRFRYGSAYANGYLYTVNGTEKLPRGQWNVLTAVLNKADNAATLYLNGTQIGTGKMGRSEVVHSTTDFYIGKDASDKKEGPFLINTFCGLIDDIAIYNEVVAPSAYTPQLANFNYPAERYAADGRRTQFHVMTRQ